MINPCDIPEDRHAPRTNEEHLIEEKFDEAIGDAVRNLAWPAIARWLPWPNDLGCSSNLVLRVVERYRAIGWHVVIEPSDRSVIATITRR
jgi:hypothetical protein